MKIKISTHHRPFSHWTFLQTACVQRRRCCHRNRGDYIVVKSSGIYMRNVRNKILMRRIWIRRCSRRDCSADLPFKIPSLSYRRRQITRLSPRRMNLVTRTFSTFFVALEYKMKNLFHIAHKRNKYINFIWSETQRRMCCSSTFGFTLRYNLWLIYFGCFYLKINIIHFLWRFVLTLKYRYLNTLIIAA